MECGADSQQDGLCSAGAVSFAGTIEDNIRLGRPGASDEEIFQAAREADIIEYMMSLPGKLQSPVLERGQNLSGGQSKELHWREPCLVMPPFFY